MNKSESYGVGQQSRSNLHFVIIYRDIIA